MQEDELSTGRSNFQIKLVLPGFLHTSPDGCRIKTSKKARPRNKLKNANPPSSFKFPLEILLKEKKNILRRTLLSRGTEDLEYGCFRKCVRLLVGYGADSANLDILSGSLYGLPLLKMANIPFISCSGPEDVLQGCFF